jgi:tetratricopeptide (TPR) repeat protein
VKGRVLAWVLVAALAAALVGQGLRWRDRILSSELVNQVEILAVTAASANPAMLPSLLPTSLANLRRAAAADPLNVEVPLARGSLYLLSRRPQEAIDSYQGALALEPHAEILRNLGDALLAAGREDEAHARYHDALRLSPWLRNQVPAGEP